MAPRRSGRRAREATVTDEIEDVSTQQEADDVEEPSGSNSQRSVRPPEELRKIAKEDTKQTVIDIENFGNQPLDRKEAQKLHGMSTDWTQVRKKFQGTAFALVRETAIDAQESKAAAAEEAVKLLAELDNTMREVIDIDTEMKANEKALSELHQRVARGEEITELVEVYEKSIKGVLNTYRNSTTRQKYGKHEEYVKYKEAVWEVDHEEAMPPINDFLPAEEGDDSDDEDLQMGGVTQDYKCPLTLTIMKDPLTSKLCHHSYSADAIREYLARGPKACPAAGCTVRITVGDLEPDPALAKRAKRFAERAARHESDSEDDADEIVD